MARADHPENLEYGKEYVVHVQFDESKSLREEIEEWINPFPSLVDNETAIGDADYSQFSWAPQMLSRATSFCGFTVWCVNFPLEGGETFPFIEDGEIVDGEVATSLGVTCITIHSMNRLIKLKPEVCITALLSHKLAG